MPKLTDVINDRDSYTGEVGFDHHGVYITGYLNEQGYVVELFAESLFGRSHLGIGTIHSVALAELDWVRLESVDPPGPFIVIRQLFGEEIATLGHATLAYGPFNTREAAKTKLAALCAENIAEGRFNELEFVDACEIVSLS